MFREEVYDPLKHFNQVTDFALEEEFYTIQTYLHQKASADNEKNISRTFIILDDESNEMTGYYTLKCSCFLTYDDDNMNNHNYKVSVPTIEICKLAVDVNSRELGMGKLIFQKYILDKAMKIGEIIPIKNVMLFVDKDNDAVGFYRKMGFVFADEEVSKYINGTDDAGCRLMYMRI